MRAMRAPPATFPPVSLPRGRSKRRRGSPPERPRRTRGARRRLPLIRCSVPRAWRRRRVFVARVRRPSRECRDRRYRRRNRCHRQHRRRSTSPGTSALGLLSLDPIHSSRGQRDSVIPPLQCPLGTPNWSGQHQEQGEGPAPSVTHWRIEAQSTSRQSLFNIIDCLFFSGSLLMMHSFWLVNSV